MPPRSQRERLAMKRMIPTVILIFVWAYVADDYAEFTSLLSVFILMEVSRVRSQLDEINSRL